MLHRVQKRVSILKFSTKQAQAIALCFNLILLLSCTSQVSTHSGDDSLTEEKRISAAQSTADSGADCKDLTSFYWEIGSADKTVTNGIVGQDFNRSTQVRLGSSVSFFLAAYMAEYLTGVPTLNDLKAMQMTYGYTGYSSTASCTAGQTVLQCFQSSDTSQTANQLGKFYYGLGHFQKWISDKNPNLNQTQFASDLKTRLGLENTISFSNGVLLRSALAGSDTIAEFLKKLIGKSYVLSESLGVSAVCTLPSSCSTSSYSVLSEDWDYSLGHWVEKEDGAFSVIAETGTYFWVDADQKYYGILARESSSGETKTQSLRCGKAIRKAFDTGKFF